MYKIDIPKAKKIMVEENHYTPQKVDLFLKDYPPIHDDLGEAVEQWLDDRTIKDTVVDGLSINEVMTKQRVHFLQAVKKLNMLLDENTPSEERKLLRKILSRQVILK
jgi:hypothetical protein